MLDSKNETALHWAVRANKLDMVDALMKHGADPFLASSGETPMEMAIANENMKNLVSLMEGLLVGFQYHFYSTLLSSKSISM